LFATNELTVGFGYSTSNALLYATQRSQSLRAFYYTYLRRHVELNLRSSAFICGFVKPWQVILTETSARIDLMDSRRITVEVTRGWIWGHGERAAL